MTKIPAVRLVPRKTGVYQVRYHAIETGKEVRLGAGRDPDQAEQFRKDVEAKLRLGIDPRKNKDDKQGRMTWTDFRERYSMMHVRKLKSPSSVEYRLNIVERAARPRYVDELLDAEKLKRLEIDLTIGCGSQKPKEGGRSSASVASILRTLKAALNFAHNEMNWIDRPCKLSIEKKHRKSPRGRPLTDDEVATLMESVKVVCGHDVDGWTFLLQGILATGLRLEEIHGMTWDQPGTIRPLQTRAGHVVLEIPADMQKNGEQDVIGTPPEFAALLDTVPYDQRKGFIFNPTPRRPTRSGERLTIQQMGRVIRVIGQASGVVVNKQGKTASAHDLRRTFAMGLIRRGVNPVDLQSVMRHSDFMTTRVFYLQAEAEEVAKRLAEKLSPAKKYLGTRADKPTKKAGSESS
ncbi:MAG: site-specific integrase [Myxococcales bacterium]